MRRNLKPAGRRRAFWRTLRFRFALWVAGLLLAALAAFGVFVYLSMGRSLVNTVDDSLRLSASQAVASLNMEDGQIQISENGADEAGTSNLGERNLSIRILDPAGNQVESFGSFWNLPLNDTDLDTARLARATFATVRDPAEGHLVRIYSEPVIEHGQLAGMVQVAQSLENVQDTLDRLLTAILLGVPLLIGVAALGGYLLATRALAPVDQMTRTAQRISAEDLSARLNLPATDDEVGRLAATFDHMISRLDAAFRRERQFTADASHDLRTPLAAMQAIISVMREERRTPEDYELALDDLAEEADRLRALTENLLHLARGDLNQTLEFDRVDIALLLHDLSDSMRPLAEKKGLALVCSLPESVVIWGDSDSLIRLFMNLLDNAIKYTQVGQVTLSLQAGDHQVDVAIADTGPGIPAADLPHIFDRFYRVEKSRAARGSGLGLAIAERIARVHGGSIRAASTPGQGTTFTVQLPFEPPAAATKPK